MKLRDRMILALVFNDSGFIINSSYTLPIPFDFALVFNKMKLESQKKFKLGDIVNSNKEDIIENEFTEKLLGLINKPTRELIQECNDKFDNIMRKYQSLEFLRFNITEEEVKYNNFMLDDRKISVPVGKTLYYTSMIKDILESLYKPPVGNYGYVIGRTYSIIPYLVSKYRYIMKLDIKRFFDSITKDVLRNILVARNITVNGANEIIKVVYGTGNEFPTGSSISPIIANILLEPLDKRFNKKNDKNIYCRYSDDITIGSNNKSELIAMAHSIKEWLSGHGFKLNNDKLKVYDTEVEPAIVFSHIIFKGKIVGIVDSKKEEYIRKLSENNEMDVRNGLIESMRKWNSLYDKDEVINNVKPFITINFDEQFYKKYAQIDAALNIFRNIHSETSVKSIPPLLISIFLFDFIDGFIHTIHKYKDLSPSSVLFAYINSDYVTELIEERFNLRTVNYCSIFRYLFLNQRYTNFDYKEVRKMYNQLLNSKNVNCTDAMNIQFTLDVNNFNIFDYDISNGNIATKTQYKNIPVPINFVVSKTSLSNEEIKKTIFADREIGILSNIEAITNILNNNKSDIANDFYIISNDSKKTNIFSELLENIRTVLDDIDIVTQHDSDKLGNIDTGYLCKCDTCEKIKVNEQLIIPNIEYDNENLNIDLPNVSENDNLITVQFTKRYSLNKKKFVKQLKMYKNAYLVNVLSEEDNLSSIKRKLSSYNNFVLSEYMMAEKNEKDSTEYCKIMIDRKFTLPDKMMSDIDELLSKFMKNRANSQFETLINSNITTKIENIIDESNLYGTNLLVKQNVISQVTNNGYNIDRCLVNLLFISTKFDIQDLYKIYIGYQIYKNNAKTRSKKPSKEEV